MDYLIVVDIQYPSKDIQGYAIITKITKNFGFSD